MIPKTTVREAYPVEIVTNQKPLIDGIFKPYYHYDVKHF